MKWIKVTPEVMSHGEVLAISVEHGPSTKNILLDGLEGTQKAKQDLSARAKMKSYTV